MAESLSGLCAGSAQRGVLRLKQWALPCNRTDDQSKCIEVLRDSALPRWYAESKSRPSACLMCPFHTIITRFKEEEHARGLSLLVRSFLDTQPQSVPLNVWTLRAERSNITRAIHRAAGKYNITERIFVRDERNTSSGFMAAMATPHAAASAHAKLTSTTASDYARFHILSLEGGIYIDSDTLFLRDLTPLCFASFAYRWSYLRRYNTAVFGCPKRCPFVQERLRTACMHESYKPNMLPVDEEALVMLPSRLFDPLWLRMDHKDHSEIDLFRTYHEINTQSLGARLLWNGLRKRVTSSALGPPSEISQTRISENDAIFPGALSMHWHGGLRGPRGTFSAWKSDTLLSRIEELLSPPGPDGGHAGRDQGARRPRGVSGMSGGAVLLLWLAAACAFAQFVRLLSWMWSDLYAASWLSPHQFRAASCAPSNSPL